MRTVIHRRRNSGPGGTHETSLSFCQTDHLWLRETARAQGVSMSLVVADALQALREKMTEAELLNEKEARRAKRAAQPEAPIVAPDAPDSPVEL